MLKSGSEYWKGYLSGQLIHDKVTLVGTPDYITLNGQVITRNKLDLSDDTNFTEGAGIDLATNTVSVKGYLTISSNAKISYDWYTASSQKLSTAYSHSQTTTGNPHQIAVSDLDETNISSPASGEVLTWDNTSSGWVNRMPTMTFDLANVRISAQQYITLTKFKCPPNKKVYLWQAAIANSGCNSVSGLRIELLSGSTIVYATSSATLVEGHPLAVTDGGNTHIRMTYSGSTITGIEYGTGFMNISVY